MGERLVRKGQLEKRYEKEARSLSEFIRQSVGNLLDGVRFERRSIVPEFVSYDFTIDLYYDEINQAPKSVLQLLAVSGVKYEKSVEATLGLIESRNGDKQFSVKIRNKLSEVGITLDVFTVGSGDRFIPSLGEAVIEGAEWLKSIIESRKVTFSSK